MNHVVARPDGSLPIMSTLTNETAGNDAAGDSPSYLLPRSVRPLAYRLVLTPDLPAATFAGDVEIDVTVVEATTTITLNAAELEITFAELNDRDPDGGYALAPTVALDPDE